VKAPAKGATGILSHGNCGNIIFFQARGAFAKEHPLIFFDGIKKLSMLLQKTLICDIILYNFI
jgi:hypothetical protein